MRKLPARESPRIESAVNEDFKFKVAVVILLILMKLARWPARRLVGWKAAWPALKKNPLDTTLLSLCGLVMYMGFPQQVSFGDVELFAWLRWSGIVLAVGTVLLLGWADYCLGKNLSVSLEIKDNHSLITSGPYRWIRHPIYASALLFSAALFLVSANWFVGLCFAGGIAILIASRIPREAKMMIGQFGDRYRDCRPW